ncbi:MAG: hypothetical protein BMS9Abin29_2274 [Gemmatimonadota bacterium]|nr:MAG: hypothetical protein BMS9Abin29_2274 [Gemmatimonadota bacterium]
MFGVILALVPAQIVGQEAGPAGPPEPEPGSDLEVFLLTMGPGRAIWELWSHNAIWIRDRSGGTDAAYNWGVFDFEQESFLSRLIRGQMLYELRSYYAPRMIDFYDSVERDVWVQDINLTPSQRLELQSLVQANDTDANRSYLYDYYTDNCSTRVRDVLDVVLDGQIRSATDSVDTGTTLRWHSARVLQSIPWAYWSMYFVVGQGGDRPLSAWEEMFLPMRLQYQLEQVWVVGADGAPIELLGPRRRMTAREPKVVPQSPPGFAFEYLYGGLALAALLALVAWRAAAGSRPARWGFALVGGAWSLAVGIAGTALVLSWFLTDHTILRLNENALQLSPLSLPLALLIPAAVFGRGVRLTRQLAVATAALSVTGLVLQVFPLFDQVNGVVIALALPVHVAVAWGIVTIPAGDRAAGGVRPAA